MRTLTSSYPCPVRMVHGGGSGTHGLCAMETLTLLPRYQGGVLDIDDADVHPTLAAITVAANDIDGLLASPEERGKALWPLLPNLLDTRPYMNPLARDMGFPREVYATRLGVSPAPYLRGPCWALRLYATKGHPRELWMGRAAEALRVALDVFWEHVDEHPRDFTPEEYATITDYVTTSTSPRVNPAGVATPPRVLVPA